MLAANQSTCNIFSYIIQDQQHKQTSAVLLISVESSFSQAIKTSHADQPTQHKQTSAVLR
jgi:hypothetical protein